MIRSSDRTPRFEPNCFIASDKISRASSKSKSVSLLRVLTVGKVEWWRAHNVRLF